MGKLNVDGTDIQVLQIEEDDYISLTDMVRNIDNGLTLIEKWLRNKNTIEFLGIWEEMYNEDFDTNAYDEIMQEAGLNRFIMSVKQWVSPQFKLYLIKEFELLKKEEQVLLGWSAKRELAKINYRIHTEAIKTNLIPIELTPQQISVIYASEADVLNMALFGMTAKQWRKNFPDKKGSLRDYASINELICLSNMENINAVLIEDRLSQKERLIKLNKIAMHQMSI
ncbi:MAG: KilA-N domain-containing protein [Lachnospiraceae bacterium]|nr:KilA-N domain-containing protein [Lachnospiraceae bacterium]